MPYKIEFSKKSKKDIDQLTSQQKDKLKLILQELVINPYLGKSLKGDLRGLYSYRLNLKDRIVYEIIPEDQIILIIRARSHYGE
jgi:toxin YoeB